MVDLKAHLNDLQRMVLVPSFPAVNFYSVRERVKKILRPRQTRNRLLSRKNGKVQIANVNKWRENKITWSLLPFTFDVNGVLSLSIKYVVAHL